MLRMFGEMDWEYSLVSREREIGWSVIADVTYWDSVNSR